MTADSSSSINVSDLLNKLKDKDFVDKIFDQLKKVLDQMNSIGRHAFQEYDEFSEKIVKFKKALLNYVLDCMIHLQVLKDNFTKKKYQDQNESVKVNFIKRNLDQIDRKVLKNYLDTCLELIELASKLRDKYGSTLFVIEYTVLSLMGSTLFGTILGSIIGLGLPFAIAAEAIVGAVTGLTVGIAYVVYKLMTNWKPWKDDIEKVRETLLEIQTGLQKICRELDKANDGLGTAQTESDLQQQQQSNSSGNETWRTFKDISDLENYVCATYDAFIDLKAIILDSNMAQTS